MTETKTERLAGRSAELAALAAMAGAASSADPQIAIVYGAAGMGKSSLVEHFLSRLDSGTVLRAAGTRWETTLDGSVLAQLLRGYDDGGTAPVAVPPDPAEAGQLLLARLRSACATSAGAEAGRP
ncbi:MAG TPA: AAA family ATPase, partial [Arthrobacter sp.]|nr:AAA family ATPase [Arthrobacter sp.]